MGLQWIGSIQIPICFPSSPKCYAFQTLILSATTTTPQSSPATLTRRRALSTTTTSIISIFTSSFLFPTTTSSSSFISSSNSQFFELPNSGGVKALELRIGSGPVPVEGDQVAIHYYGRLGAKQGWRFDSTYDHKDNTGQPIPFVFTIGSANVISGIESAVRTMQVGGIRRVIIPPSQGYQNTTQEPIPPNAEAFYYDFQSNSSSQRRRFHLGNSNFRY